MWLNRLCFMVLCFMVLCTAPVLLLLLLHPGHA
jgi:hypothetical protein